MGLFKPEIGLVFWMLVVFLIILAILAKYAWPVIIRSIEQRADFIDSGVKFTREAKQRLDEVETKVEEMLAEAHRKQLAALQETERMKREMIENAKKEAADEVRKMMEEAKASMEQAKREAEKQMRRQVSRLSLEIAEKVLRKDWWIECWMSWNQLRNCNDMDEGLIARRYALAMLKVAQKYNAAEEVYQKMKTFEQNYISHPDLHKALLNPILSPRDKEQLLTIAIGIEPGTLYLRGIRLLIKNHREMYIRSICLMYQKLYRKVYQIGRIKIITAVALKQETLDRIKKLVTDRTSRQIEFVEKVDPAIIGGFVLRVNSMQLDYSVGGELKKIAKQLK